MKGAGQGRPGWLPAELPLPDDLVIDISSEVGKIRSLRGSTKSPLGDLRELYRSAATRAGYAIAEVTPDAEIPGQSVVLLAYSAAGEPLDIRVSANGALALFIGRFWEAPAASSTSTLPR